MVAELSLLEKFSAADVIGWQARRPVDAARFCNAALALAAALPGKRYVLNLCEDRLSFMLGFSAAMLAGQVSLLPYSKAHGVVRDLYASRSDVYCLAGVADEVPGGLPAVVVPPIAASSAPVDVPCFPAGRVALVAYTSGSTGEPQAHSHTWGSLVADARALGRQLGLSDGRAASVVGTVPPQHIYGMETTVMLPMQNGMPVHPGRPLLPADIAAALEPMPGERWLVTTPTHLRACVSARARMPQLAGVLSATMPLAPELAREMEQAWSAPLHEIYGCTEGGALALRRPTLSERWRVRDGMRLRATDDGVWVEGGHLSGALRIPDRVALVSDTQFDLLGRPEDMAKIAGKRVSIEALNRELLRVPGVKEGLFIDTGKARGGVARLAAVAVAPGLAPQAILRALRERIDPAFLPRPLLMVESLPRGATGKVARTALLELLEAAIAAAKARSQHLA